MASCFSSVLLASHAVCDALDSTWKLVITTMYSVFVEETRPGEEDSKVEAFQL